MRVNWVRVRNFRSIVDSGIIPFDERITVFAGKNESGKSNLLLGLERFNDGEFEEDDCPQGTTLKPSVEVAFSVEGHELQSVREFDWPLERPLELIIKKTMDSSTSISGAAWDTVAKSECERRIELKKTLSTKLSSVSAKHGLKLALPKPDVDTRSFLTEARKALDTMRQTVMAESPDEPAQIEEAIDELHEVHQTIIDYWSSVLELVPRFVRFDTFEDVLPDDVSREEAKNKEIVRKFFEIVGIDIDDFFSADGQKLQHLMDEAGAQVSGDFAEFYKQADLMIKVSLMGPQPRAYFYVYDVQNGKQGTALRPEQRSKGLQWFLSFYLMLKSQPKGRIILIDEPGLYLHAKAQKDVLRILERMSEESQIAYSTHSPFLIDPDHLERVRLVVKDETQKTVVIDKVTKGADRDTMTPIITAIGLDLTSGVAFGHGLNVVVEGMSDYYYILAMKQVLRSKKGTVPEELKVIPSVGASQIPNLVALMIGWELPFCVVVDHDGQGRETRKQLIRGFRLPEDKVLFVDSDRINRMEDMFSRADFIKWVLPEGFVAPEGEQNSKIVKALDKTMLAREFYCRAISGKVKVDDETTSRFSLLFQRIAEGAAGLREAAASKE